LECGGGQPEAEKKSTSVYLFLPSRHLLGIRFLEKSEPSAVAKSSRSKDWAKQKIWLRFGVFDVTNGYDRRYDRRFVPAKDMAAIGVGALPKMGEVTSYSARFSNLGQAPCLRRVLVLAYSTAQLVAILLGKVYGFIISWQSYRIFVMQSLCHHAWKPSN
jgi:hypothetical protein